MKRVTGTEISVAEVVQVAYHQNDGGGGVGFLVVLFTTQEQPGDPKMAVVFDHPGAIAVFDLDLLDQGVIAFGECSFKSANFETALRGVIESAQPFIEQSAFGGLSLSSRVN